MKKAKQISVCLENKTGRLASLCKCLAQKKINIIAISVAETTEQGVVRIAQCGPMTCAQMDVLLVDLPNKVGVLAELAAKLASKRINVNFVYGSTGTGRGTTNIVVGTPNIKSAAKAIRSRK